MFTKYAEELRAWTSACALLTKLGFEEWEVLHQLQTRSLESYRTGWALSIAEAEALEGVIAREFE